MIISSMAYFARWAAGVAGAVSVGGAVGVPPYFCSSDSIRFSSQVMAAAPSLATACSIIGAIDWRRN
jgi:hypothetical protein